MRTLRLVPLALLLLPLSSCTCQRPENIEAKAKLSKAAPPDPHVKAADEKIDAHALTDKAKLRRVITMEGTEVATRLGSFRFDSKGDLSFARGGGGLKSGETTRMLQAKPHADGGPGDFAVEVKTGDGSEMRLAYVNEIFFLKNNNGKWRMSRDPGGERNAYRSDALGVWKGFYDLVSHSLIIEPNGGGSHEGRDVVKYKLGLPDQSGDAKAAGAQLPPLPVGPDGGPVDEPAAEKMKRMRERMSSWRERAKPAGGSGEMWIDAATGVPLVVKFNGMMVVGDGPDPSVLKVNIDAKYSEIGKDQRVQAPKDAIEEIVRTKMPVRPREILEQEGVVDPLPRDAGPGGGGAGSRAAGNKGKAGEIPDDPEE